jgi:hypothetical protein
MTGDGLYPYIYTAENQQTTAAAKLLLAHPGAAKFGYDTSAFLCVFLWRVVKNDNKVTGYSGGKLRVDSLPNCKLGLDENGQKVTTAKGTGQESVGAWIRLRARVRVHNDDWVVVRVVWHILPCTNRYMGDRNIIHSMVARPQHNSWQIATLPGGDISSEDGPLGLLNRGLPSTGHNFIFHDCIEELRAAALRDAGQYGL